MKNSTRISMVIMLFWIAFIGLGAREVLDIHGLYLFQSEEIVWWTIIGAAMIWVLKFLFSKMVDKEEP